ncbi:hypothetical protein IJ103_02695 [Candidatus Saccharibacteria bacterium]|nr:hypothetical protein [Candidatus Saccharibacteria bacterium]
MDLSAVDQLDEQTIQIPKNLPGKSFSTFKSRAPLVKRTVVVCVIICISLVVVNAVASAYFNPKTSVERELSALAEEYYEDYLYERLVGDRTGDEVAKELKNYREVGVTNTYLRQLLLYDSGRRKAAAGYFENCNRNETYVKYYPDPPYGKQDYHFDIKLACES